MACKMGGGIGLRCDIVVELKVCFRRNKCEIKSAFQVQAKLSKTSTKAF